jgi:hypothetical protein
MMSIWLNCPVKHDEARRQKLYAGEICTYDRLRSVEEFARFTREMVETALAPHDPPHVHEVLTPGELAPILGRLKPTYTHHPEARRLVTRILEELGVDLDDCYLDVPKLRTSYPTGHLTKGIAYAFGGHRDTWYGSPQAQINWWLPIYPLTTENAMAFYPRYFSKPVANDSERFNYYRRNVERRDVAKFVDADPRIQPSAIDLDPDEPEFRLLPDVGGIIVFSGAQLHATVSSPTAVARYSVDFRTVSRRDVERGLGAPNVDARCTGTALRDFRRASDAAPMPEELVRRLDPIGPAEGELAVFKPGA